MKQEPVLVSLTKKLDRSLLALQAAQTPASLAQATFGCIQALVSATEMHLIFSHGEGLQPKLFRFSEGSSDVAGALLHLSWRNDPLVQLIMAKPANEPFHLRTTLTENEISQSRFGARWFRQPGAPHGVIFPITARVSSSAMICLFRKAELGDFTAEEMGLLDWFGAHFKLAWLRVFVREESLAINYSLQNLLRHSSTGLVLLNWDLKAVYRNNEAAESCLLWNFGPDAARKHQASAVFHCPAAILEAAQKLKACVKPIQEIPASGDEPDSPSPATITESSCVCQGPEGMRAEVRLVSLKTWALGRPVFQIHISRQRQHEAERKPAVRPTSRLSAELGRLTPRERELVDYVCRGLSNESIAQQLSKSVPTVKNQLRSIFQKLALTSRTELMARMHQPASK